MKGSGTDTNERVDGTAVIDHATLAEIVGFVWHTFVGEPGIVEVDPGSADAPNRFATIAIGGGWTATLVVATTHELTARFAGALLGLDPADLDPADIDDAFGDLVNAVGANVKSFVDDPTATLSLPVVTPSRPSVTRGQLTLRTAFEIAGPAMSWELWERL